jgi:hypothetical protein
MRLCLIGPGLLLLCGSAFAEPVSRYSSIENKACKFAPIGNEPGDDEDQSKTCPGPAGTQVLVNALGTRLRVGFGWTGRPPVAPVPAVVEAWSAGEKIEWRGDAGKGFAPYAATVRMLYPKEDTGQVGQQLLAVMRVARGEACLMGVVDIRANRKAYELAREIADRAPTFACGKDRPSVAGTATEWTQRLLAPIAR